jgi:hypothetical protein
MKFVLSGISATTPLSSPFQGLPIGEFSLLVFPTYVRVNKPFSILLEKKAEGKRKVLYS